jgi:hypothetical protein
LEVTGTQAKFYVKGMDKPVLVMNDLKSGIQKGRVALAVLMGETYFSNCEIRTTADVDWESHPPPMPPGTLTKWSLSPSYDALERKLEHPLSRAESDAIHWQEVERINSERDHLKKLYIGYSDDVSVFLNGQILFRGRSAQNFRDPGFLGIVNPENDAIYLSLKKGNNDLMLAVSELGGGWGFICRLVDLGK